MLALLSVGVRITGTLLLHTLVNNSDEVLHKTGRYWLIWLLFVKQFNFLYSF